MRRTSVFILATFGALLGIPGAAADDIDRRLDRIEAEYERRIEELEARVAELESQLESAAPRVEAESHEELDELRAAAAAAAAEAVAEPTEAIPTEATVGHERNLNRFNPEISFSGDVLGLARDGHQDFQDREFELDFQSTLDPFSSTKWTIAFSPEEGVEIEEGYIRYSGILPGLTLRAGKMRQTFGLLNRWHLHALPQTSYPLVIQEYLGEEGLAQTGVSAEWLLPAPWATTSELTLQLTDGSAEIFGGEDFEDLVGLAHLKSYWDLSPATYLEWGLSGAVGSPDEDRDTEIWGTDLTLSWQPPGRAKYRGLTWRTEVLLSRRDDLSGLEHEALGAYSYVEGTVARNWSLGLRGDWIEEPLSPDDELWAVEPYVSWWQSEYVRLRAAYRYLRDETLGEGDGELILQLTWAAGPHKHETY